MDVLVLKAEDPLDRPSLAEDPETGHCVLRRLASQSVLEYDSCKKEAKFSRHLHDVFKSQEGTAEQVLYKGQSTSKLRTCNIVASRFPSVWPLSSSLSAPGRESVVQTACDEQNDYPY